MPDRFSVEIHHDFAVLEDRLAEILRTARASGGPLAPIAIIVPTRRLIAHLQVTLATNAGALHGTRFFHHDGLARAIAAAAGVGLPRLLGDGAKEAILADLARRGGGDLAAWFAERPGGAAALRTTIEDLREAGVDPRAALSGKNAVAGRLSEGSRQVLDLYGAYVAALARLQAAGFSDRAGRAALAAPHAAAFACRFDLLVHYGAYELTGANLDLLRALGSAGRPVRVLAPGHPSAPAFAYARGFWRDHLGVEPVVIAPGGSAAGRILGDRLPLLYEEDARPEPARGPIAFLHSQGPAAEMGEAARLLLIDSAALQGGTAAPGPASRPPARTAVIARTLEPYALHLGSVFTAHGIPIQTSAVLPAARQPAVQAASRLLRCLVADFPATTLCDLLRSGRLRAVGGTAPPRADIAERLLRDWQITGGRTLIAERLPEWVEADRPHLPAAATTAEREEAEAAAAARARDARRLAALVRLLAREAGALRAARGFGAWAAAFSELLGRLVTGFAPDETGDPGAEVVREALDDLAALDAAGIVPGPGDAAAALERALEAATLPVGSAAPDGTPQEGDGGGARVLDAMQARGLSFDTVILIGMNADLFPRRPREDPFLPDDDRRLLRAALGRPLPVASEGRDEEHLLLAHLLGAAGTRIVVSWQRADDAGRARTPSLALREIARLAFGSPDLDALHRAARRISADPAARILDAVRDDRLIAPGDAGLAAAFVARSPGRLAAALAAAGQGATGAEWMEAHEGLRPGLAFLEAIDGAAPAGFDALAGAPGDEPALWSPSRLETLGSCPQQFFFRHVLHVDEWEPPPEAHESDVREMGALVHEVLRDLYAALWPAPDGAAGRTPDTGHIRPILQESWDRRSGPIAGRMRALYPGLWALLEAQWIAAIEEFARGDAAHLAAAAGPVLLEHEAEAAIPIGAGQDDLRLRGRFDRVVRGDNRVVVSDYKTAGRPEAHVEAAPILKGRRLQMPLYVLLAERASGRHPPPAVHAEVLGVGPAFAGLPPTERVATLGPDRFDDWRDGFLETLVVLRELARSGLYPLDAASERCRRCPYAPACRRGHPQTVERLAADPALARFHATRRKSSRAPTLERVAAAQKARS